MRLSSFIIPAIVSISIGSVFGIYTKSILVVSTIIFIIGLVLFIKATIGKYSSLSIISICMIGISIGLLSGGYIKEAGMVRISNVNNINKYTNIVGIIDNNPEQKGDKQVFTLVENGRKIEVKSSLLPSLSYGDKIEVYGRLKFPENFTTPNGKEVRYHELLRARGIDLQLEAKKHLVISSRGGNKFYEKIYLLKRSFNETTRRLPDPESGLLFSMVFGGKSSLPKDIIEYFRIAGLLHIVVLSGQNLTIVSYLTLKIFSYSSGFRWGHTLAILAIFLYAAMGGLEAATIRALLMSSALIISTLLGKPSLPGRVLLLSASLMIIVNPYLLIDDPSFQLSVLAFSGIIFITPIIERWLILKNISSALSSYLSAILGAQISVMPLIVYSSQSITPYSLLSNFFTLIVAGFITVYGMISVMIGQFSVYIFDIVSFPLYFILKYIIWIAKLISSLPFSVIEFKVDFIYIALIYFVLILYIIKIWRKDYMTPLSIFTLKIETESIKRGNIPWVNPMEAGTAYDRSINENDVIKW